MSTPSPVTSAAEVSDDAASLSPIHEPEREPRATRKPRQKRDPAEQRAAYLAKRREIKARARSRKKETAASLSEQHTLLQKQLDAALAKYHESTRAVLQQRLNEQEGRRLRQLWDAYVEALGLQEAITKENQHLIDRIDEFLLVECRLLLPEFRLDDEDRDGEVKAVDPMVEHEAQLLREAQSMLQRRGYWTQFQEEFDAPFYFEFYREDECNAVIARKFEAMQRDIREASARQWAFSAGCYGWKGYGNIDADDAAVVRFQFRKTLTRASSSDLIDEMASQTSRIFHTPELYARLYGMRMESQTMQRVDDHTTILLQSMSDEHRTISMRSFMLFTSVEERLPPTPESNGKPRRCLTIMNMFIPPREQDVPQRPLDPRRMVLYLTECLIFMRLEQINENDLHVIYGGSAHCLSPELARICVLESVSSFFRWVQQVIPERLVMFN